MPAHTDPLRATQPDPIHSVRRWHLLVMALVALGVTFWMEPVQAAPPTNTALPSPHQSVSPLAPASEPESSVSPLADQPVQLPFTPLSELPVQMTDVVAALNALQASHNLVASPDLNQSLFPLSGLFAGNPPPVITQPDPPAGAPATLPILEYSIYLPIIFGSAQVIAEPADSPPFSCDYLAAPPNTLSHATQTQCQALVALYASTQGEKWALNGGRNDGWLQESNPCHWYGVSCQEGVGVVTLELSNNGLSGYLPEELGLLPLRKLDVSNNSLGGTLPNALLDIYTLWEIYIHSNQLEGSYPLVFFNKYSSRFGWPDRRKQFRENRFHRLDASRYRCDGETIAVADCRALVAFFRSTGGENLNGIYWGEYGGNWLVGRQPCKWSWLSCENRRVTKLDFPPEVSRGLKGSLPVELGNLTALTYLNLNGAQLSGPLPAELGNLSALTYLSMDGTQLSGLLPAELGNLTGLTYLSMDGARLSGPLPEEVGNLSALKHLSVNESQLNGSLPATIGHLSNLRVLRIKKNDLSGWLPATLGDLEKLEELDLAGNQLTGPLPASLGKFKVIRLIDLRDNSLSGVVPEEIQQINDNFVQRTNGTSIAYTPLQIRLEGNDDLCIPPWFNRLTEMLGLTGSRCPSLAR